MGRNWAVGLGGPLLGQKAKKGRQMAKQEVRAWRGIRARWPCLSAPAFCPLPHSSSLTAPFHPWVLPSCCCSLGPAIPVNLLHCLPPQAPAVPRPLPAPLSVSLCPLLTR